jgi:elongation factor P
LDVQATQLRPGMLIKWKGTLYSVFSVMHRTPGNLRGFVQAKMRNVSTRSMNEHRFASEDFVERVVLEEHEMEYLYNDGDVYHFMNTESFEQIGLNADDLGDQVLYLLPNTKVNIQFYVGNPFSVNLPTTVDMDVLETEPAIKGATVTNVTKPAKLETGLVVQVPPFIKEGEKIRINTTDGSYVTRAS